MIRVISESYETHVTLDDIVNATYSASFMNDRASITIGTRNYIKIGKNKWEYNPMNEHALGGIYTDKEIYDMSCKSNDIKFYR